MFAIAKARYTYKPCVSASIRDASGQLDNYERPVVLLIQKYLQFGAIGSYIGVNDLYVHANHHTALLYYDHVVTFVKEVSTIWRFPLSRSSILFLSNRYLSFFSFALSTAVKFMDASVTSCRRISVFHQCVLVAVQFLVAVILLLRTFALYGRDFRLLYMLATVGIIQVAAASWFAFSASKSITYEVDPVLGCYMVIDRTAGLYTAGAWETILISDIVIFTLTAVKTYKDSSGSMILGRPSMHTVMFRDGAIYFIVMVLANLANIITYYAVPPLLKNSLASIASCISVTMISRLMLNLHKAANTGIMPSIPMVRHCEDTSALFRTVDPTDSRLSLSDEVVVVYDRHRAWPSDGTSPIQLVFGPQRSTPVNGGL